MQGAGHVSALALALAALATAPGCIPHSPFAERPQVSRDVSKRSGHSLRSDAEPVVALPPGIAIDRPLSSDEAVAIALWNNAPFQEVLSRIGLSRAELAQAGLLSNPTLAVLFPLGPKQLEFAATLPVEFLWLRPDASVSPSSTPSAWRTSSYRTAST